MKIFAKYLLKSISEKKGRTVLILISVALSCALFVACFGTVDSIIKIFEQTEKGMYEDYNVTVSPNSKADQPVFSTSEVEMNKTNDINKCINIGGYFKKDNSKQFNLSGMSYSDFKKFKSIKMIKQNNLEDFEGNKIIISQKMSDVLKVKLNDEITLCILGKEYKYKIAGIASNTGLFLFNSNDSFRIITPYENVSSIYDVNNKYTSMLVSVNSSKVKTWISDFNKNNKDKNITASLLYDEKQVEAEVKTFRTPLLFMLSVVLLMTMFIIYSCFKLIITERIPVIGTFLSQGATKGKISIIFLQESFVYGVLGGVLGDGLGALVIYIATYFCNPLKEYGVKPSVEYNPKYFILGFIFAIVLSLISSVIPILAIRKMPVKDVILNTLGSTNTISKKNFIIGIVLLALAAIFHFIGSSTNYVLSIPGILAAIVGIILIIPMIVKVVFYPFVRILRNANGISMLSLNNVRTSKVLINNIRLIVLSCTAVLIIISLGNSTVSLVDGAYKKLNYNVEVGMNTSNVNNLKFVNDFMNKYDKTANIFKTDYLYPSLNGDSTKTMIIQCINSEDFKKFDNYVQFDDRDKQLDELKNNDDGIIISKQISSIYKIKKGDTITLTIDDKKEKLKVLSIFDAKFESGGKINLISWDAALKHFDDKYPTSYCISSKASEKKTKKELDRKLKGLGVSITTKTQNLIDDDKNNKYFINILSAFSYITMIIGGFGILSNVSISFIQRKRELAVLSSVGLTRAGRGKLVLAESIFEALIGILMSVCSVYIMLIFTEDAFAFASSNMELSYPAFTILPASIAAILLMLIASLASIHKSKKMQIISEIKYE